MNTGASVRRLVERIECDMMDDTRDIRITRLEGRVQVLENVQSAMLDKMDVFIANQNEMRADLVRLEANQVRIIELIQALTLEVADLKDRIIGRPMGFVLPEDDDS